MGWSAEQNRGWTIEIADTNINIAASKQCDRTASMGNTLSMGNTF
jgi:hypothetical protein